MTSVPPKPILTSCIAVSQFARFCKNVTPANGEGLLLSLFVDTLIVEKWELAYMLHLRIQQPLCSHTNCIKNLRAVRLTADLLSQRPVLKARSFDAQFVVPKVALE